MKLPLVLERLALTLWIGGMLLLGYVVVPVLFSSLNDRLLAGNIAGQLFGILNYVGLVCAAILLAIAWSQSKGIWFKSWRAGILIIMVVLVAISEFGLAPAISEITQGGTTLAKDAQDYGRFKMLHGSASALYLVNTVLGITLVVFGVVERDG